MVLKKGSKGNSVKVLQTSLKKLGFDIVINSVFDDATLKAVLLEQENANLVQDGIVGIKTITAINKEIKALSANYNEKIVWLSPLQLKASIQNKKSSDIVRKFANFVNANFFSNGKCIGWLISDGKILSRRDEYKTWKGNKKATFAVLKDGTVIVDQLYDSDIIKILDQIQFCCQGFIDISEGLDIQEVGRKCLRPMIGFNKNTNKVLICVFNGDWKSAKNIAEKYKLDNYVLLDGGGSTNLYVSGKGLYITPRVLNSIVYWN